MKFLVDGQQARVLTFLEYIYVSFAEALGVVTTGFSPVSWGGRALQIIERFSGTLFLALLVASAYRRIRR